MLAYVFFFVHFMTERLVGTGGLVLTSTWLAAPSERFGDLPMDPAL